MHKIVNKNNAISTIPTTIFAGLFIRKLCTGINMTPKIMNIECELLQCSLYFRTHSFILHLLLFITIFALEHVASCGVCLPAHAFIFLLIRKLSHYWAIEPIVHNCMDMDIVLK